MLKTFCAALSLTLAALALSAVTTGVEAKRLGGGRPAGMQRQMPATPSQGNALPARQVQPTQAAPTPQPMPVPQAPLSAPAKRSWMGPLAGLAAGLGIGALMSHFGFMGGMGGGGGMGDLLSLALFALVAFMAGRWLLGRMRGNGALTPNANMAGAGAPWPGNSNNNVWEPAPTPMPAPVQRTALPSDAPLLGNSGLNSVTTIEPHAAALPGFDAAGFERAAKLIFVRMQAANDAADVEDLRKFTTPELFASLRLDLQDRGAAKPQTDVVQLNACVVNSAQEGPQQIVSVRFDGLIREDIGGAAAPFDEIWHLVRPADGSRDWAIAGIAPIN